MMKNKLTQKQKEAVESTSPSTMVIAGPGTGKTHMLASRIEYLVKHMDIPPESILALTFTKSGAGAMKERVIDFLGEEGYRINTNTFHGFASSLFEEFPQQFSFGRNLKEATDIDRAKIIEGIIDKLTETGELKELYSPYDKYHYFNDISGGIKQIKKEGITVEEFKKLVEGWQDEFDSIPDEEKLSSRGPRQGQIKREYEKEQKNINKNRELALIYERYEKQMHSLHLFDYEDMIMRAIEGLEENESLRHELQERYGAILVDEYQDTSGGQNRLLFLLIPESSPNIFIVGDDDQAIYRFQGATIENFRVFLEKYPDTKIISLEDNFRSPRLLLDAALNLANSNTERLTAQLELPDKKLTAHGEFSDSSDITVNEFKTDTEEHAFIVEQVLKLNKEGTPWNEISVITRTNREQEELSEILRAHGIPVYVSGSINALDDPYVSSLFALARACLDPRDNEAMLEFLLHPATPIARGDVWRILEQKSSSLFTSFRELLEKDGLSNKEAAQKTFDVINELSGSLTVKTGAHWLKELLDKTGFLEWVLKQDDYPYILANIRALTDEAKRIQAGNPEMRVRGILEHFASHRRLGIPLKPSLASAGFDNALQLMTAHKVKGLEYENVFITHAVQQAWSKSKRSRGLKLPGGVPVPDTNEEDERKLFYVALTRAKKRVFVTYSKVYTKGIGGTSEDARETQSALFTEELKKHIDSKAIEKDVSDFLVQSLKEPEPHTDLEREVVKNIVNSPSYALNPTALNAFLECPRQFLYEKILRVPTVQTPSLTYGNAIHSALQRFFEIPQEKRTLENLLMFITEYIEKNSTLTEGENKQMLARAKESMGEYFESTLKNEGQPLYVEYRFKKGTVAWEGVRIAGIIDKVSPLEPASSQANSASNGTSSPVRFVDYKTSQKHKTKNAVLGGTKDKNAPKMHRQLMFYKLLAEADEAFKYEPKEFVLDFVEVNKQIDIPIEKEAYEQFKQELKGAWENIQSLQFLESTELCGECTYCKLQH